MQQSRSISKWALGVASLMLGCSGAETVNTGGSGGATASGTSATGGATAVGGTGATSGTVATAGTTATSGTNAAGGASSMGGTTSTSGTRSSGGTTSTFKCDNLLSAAGATGQAKPSGTVGGLKVLDWAGFKGAVSFTFDDNQQTQVDNMTALKATGARMTFFIVSSWANAANAAYKTAASEGHEIGNHTSTHNTTGDITTAKTCQTFINSNYGVTAYTMAAPDGNAAWVTSAPQLFFANRGVSDGLIAPRDGTSAFNLPAYLPPKDASSSVMDNAVNLARTGGSWKIFCVHGFDINDTNIWQPVTITNMTTTMSNAVASGNMWVDTMMNVAAYWLGQKAISASATTSATWTLPSDFPPNMCVRVTTTGGTVKQNGVEVPWNAHGYYEISLDAQSVTVQ